ncbi:MAG: hypothetical protein IJS51_09970 [Treponema sp.]|nr:hypothetical protein [Treponema sp.]
MTVCKKIFAVSLACALLAANVYAQDDWGSDGAAAEETSEPTFWDRFKISGDASLAGRAYFDGESVYTTTTAVNPRLKLGFDYEGNATKFSSKLRFDEQTLRYDNEMILDEFSADLFVGNWVLSAGKMKVVWGKGDKLHVLDNFNSNNYYDFLIPDYLDRRNSEYMFRAQYNSPLGFRLEGIYTPIMHGETYAQKGPWVPNKVTNLTSTVTQALAKANQTYSFGGLMTAINAKDNLYPETNSLEYGQFGGYLNFTVGLFDFGVSYYNGRYKQVSADVSEVIKSKLGSYVITGTGMPSLHYDKMQSFGLDMQTALGPFTIRAEGVFNLTKDMDGSDPWTHNNNIGYLLGFDVSLPIHNVTLNVQGTGNIVLNKDKIDNYKILGRISIPGTKQYDVDYDPTGCYTNHKIVVQLQDTFYYEKVTATIKAIYGIERSDLLVMPELSFKVRDGWKVAANGLYIHNFDKEENSEFYGWLNNSFVQLTVNYTF